MNHSQAPSAGGGRIPLAAALLGGLIAFVAASLAGWLDGLQPAQLFLRAGLTGLALGGLSLVLGKLGMQVILEPARPRPPPSTVAGGPGATGPPGGTGPPSGPGMRG